MWTVQARFVISWLVLYQTGLRPVPYQCSECQYIPIHSEFQREHKNSKKKKEKLETSWCRASTALYQGNADVYHVNILGSTGLVLPSTGPIPGLHWSMYW